LADFRELQDVVADERHGLARAGISGVLSESGIRDADCGPVQITD
jgi:hypothetical protein